MAQVKINKINKSLNLKKLDKMLHHFETYNFIKLSSNKAIQFSFISENLKEIIRKEWLLANLMFSDHPSFLFSSLKTAGNLNSAFESIKNLTSSVPFSFIEVENNHHVDHIETNPLPQPSEAAMILSNQFKVKSGTILRHISFYSPENAEEHFYKLQRKRKIWWRKFASCPGRFSISNLSTKESDNSVTSEILAEFPWGQETVETIKYLPEFFTAGDKDVFEVKVGKRKKSIPKIITCETLLENMAFTYLCDSYENINGQNERDFLRFDKKLAPYKLSIAGTGESSEIIKDLEELSLLLAKQIRRLGISVLLLPDACTTNVEKQVLRNDALGVPYTLLLNDNSLKDGIIFLRSRDTTLQEHSHVGIIAEYLEKIFK